MHRTRRQHPPPPFPTHTLQGGEVLEHLRSVQAYSEAYAAQLFRQVRVRTLHCWACWCEECQAGAGQEGTRLCAQLSALLLPYSWVLACS